MAAPNTMDLEMPDGSVEPIPKDWSRQQIHDYIEQKHPGAFDQGRAHEEELKTTWGKVKDVGKSIGGDFERGVAGLAGLPGTVVDLANKTAELTGGKTIDNPLPNPQDILGGYEEMRGRPTYEPETGWGEALGPLGGFTPGLIGGPEGIVGRALTNVAAPAAGTYLGGKAVEQLDPELKPIGEAVGGITGLVLGKGARASRIPEVAGLKTSTGIAEDVDAALKRARDAGVFVKRDTLKSFTDDLAGERAAFSKLRHPKSKDIVARFDKMIAPDATGKFNNNMTLDQLEGMRQDLNAIISEGGTDAAAAMGMKRKFTKFLNEKIVPGGVTGGNTREGLKALSDYRSLYNRQVKSEDIEALFRSAEFKAAKSPAEKGEVLRRKLIDFVANKDNLKGYTAWERQTLEEAAKGTGMERFLTNIGKFTPGTSLGGMAGGGAGYGLGGLKGMLALGVPTGTAKWLGGRMSLANAQRAYDTVRGGEPIAAPKGAGVLSDIAAASGASLPYRLPELKFRNDKTEQELQDEELFKRLGLIEEGQRK